VVLWLQRHRVKPQKCSFIKKIWQPIAAQQIHPRISNQKRPLVDFPFRYRSINRYNHASLTNMRNGL